MKYFDSCFENLFFKPIRLQALFTAYIGAVSCSKDYLFVLFSVGFSSSPLTFSFFKTLQHFTVNIVFSEVVVHTL